MLNFSFKMKNLAVYCSLIVIIFVSIMIVCVSSGSVKFIGEDNIDIVLYTQAVVLTSLTQDNLNPASFVYLDDPLYGSPPEHIFNEFDLPKERVNNPVANLYSEDFSNASPPGNVYNKLDSNDNDSVSQPVSQPVPQPESNAENELDVEKADAETLPMSGSANYIFVIGLWLFIAASYSLRTGIVGKKVLESYNLDN